MAQVLEEWEPASYQRHLEDLEVAMRSAAQVSAGAWPVHSEGFVLGRPGVLRLR